MKIVNNKTLHCIFVNKTMLVPGTNCLDSFDEESAPVKAFIESEQLEVMEADKMNDKQQADAVKNANTTATLDTLKKKFKNVDVSKQKKKLDDFDKAVDEANKIEEGAEG